MVQLIHATHSRPTSPSVVVPVGVPLVPARTNNTVISTALVPAVGREHDIRAAHVIGSSTLVEPSILNRICGMGRVIWGASQTSQHRSFFKFQWSWESLTPKAESLATASRAAIVLASLPAY